MLKHCFIVLPMQVLTRGSGSQTTTILSPPPGKSGACTYSVCSISIPSDWPRDAAETGSECVAAISSAGVHSSPTTNAETILAIGFIVQLLCHRAKEFLFG